MAGYSWADLQAAADAAGFTAWVIDNEGGWSRQPVEVLENWERETTLRQHLTQVGTVLRWRNVVSGGRVRASEPWVWVHRCEGANEYVAVIDLNGHHDAAHCELVVARGLPAYLQLLSQLRQAGIGTGA